MIKTWRFRQGQTPFSRYICPVKSSNMYFEKIHNKGQAQLFKNPYLEMLTKTHPLVIWGMYTPVMVYMLYYSGNTLGFSTTRTILTFLGGMFFWSFFEYLAHRF